MKTLKTLLAAALLCMGTSAMAQESYTDDEGVKYEFQKHWFLDVQGGGQYTLGESKFANLLSPNAQLGLGYQFSPVIGLRLQVNAWQSRGGFNGYQSAPGAIPYTRDYKWTYFAPGLDLQFNLSNLICGYNPTRTLNVLAFLGAGANVAFDNGQAKRVAAHVDPSAMEYLWRDTQILPFARGGFDLDIRLSDKVSLLLEANANMLSDKYNSKKAGNADWYFNALAGLRFNLGKTHKKYVPEVRIPGLRYGPNGEILADTVYITKTNTVRDTVYVEQPASLRRDIFFTIGKWNIRDTELSKVADIANYMQRYPASKVKLCGYADVKTGNDRINDQLGLNRVNAVKDMLVEKYGIPASRILTDSKGAHEQPFPVNEDNRVTIAICE